MKHSVQLMLLSVVLLLLCLGARAGSITEGEARAKAWSFLQSQNSSSVVRRLSPARTPAELNRSNTGESSLYVFNVGEQDGFIIVSGDDRTRSILGYADRGSFDADHVPAALREMMSIYVRQIEQIGQTKDSVRVMSRSPRRISGNMVDVEPLLSTTWNQYAPYNAYCPTLDDQTSLTGCVATAMAQIANYYEYPTESVPSLAAYTTSTNKINVSAWGTTTFDWDNMLDNYDGGYTSAQQTAVATLMRYCGQAAQMDYGFTSGAYNGDALYAFKEKLGYNANADFRSAANYSADGWEDLIYKEVSANRPVYYSALNGDVGCDVSGHAFVIDGYRTSGNYFHVNWGWGGACNGYFNLFALDPSSPESAVTTTGWHYQMLAIVGLSPEEASTATLSKDASGSYLITSADDWSELSASLSAYAGESFKLTSDISVTTMVGTEGMPFSGTFDGQGHTLTVNIESDQEYTAPFHWAVGCTFKNLTVAGNITVTQHFAGGLIGWADEVTLQNCESKVTIQSNYWGDGTHGGFISIVRGGTARFYDCVFSGAIIGPETVCCGGFCGWRDGGVEVYNCLNRGRFELSSNQSCSTFSRNGVNQFNSYYVSTLADAMEDNQGTAITAEQLAGGSAAYALQSGPRDWTTGLVWGQQIGTDATPVLTNDSYKRVNKVSFAIYGQIVETFLTNETIGDRMPVGDDYGLTNVTFTYNGAPFTSTTPITGDIVVDVNGTPAYTLTLAEVTNGSISINNNACMPGMLKKVTAVPSNNYVVSAVKVTDASGNLLPVTQVSNSANEYVFSFPKSSVTITAEFVAGESEATRFINGGMTLPSSWRSGDQHWTADTWMIWGDEFDGTYDVIVGAPPTDVLGHQWYEEGYALTNSDSDVLPNGNKIVWENHAASFRDGGNYDYYRETGAPGENIGDFYIRRIFTFNTENIPSKLYLSCSYDDSPVEYYINGTLVYKDHNTSSWHDGCYEVALTAQQIALIHTDGTPNVLAVHTSQNWGGYHLDCGLYDPTALSYEVTGDATCRVLPNAFMTGDVTIPATLTHNGKTYTVTELANDAFYDCSDLTSVTLPSTIEYVGNNAFANCGSLQYVKSHIAIYQNETLLAAPMEATEFELPMGYTSIYRNAFKFTESLKTLTLPRSLSYIGERAFSGCKSLNEIYAYSIPVANTDGNAFEGLNKSDVTVHVYASALNSYKESWGEEFNYVTMPDPQPIEMLTINVTDAGSLSSLIDEAIAEKDGSVYDVQGITVTGNINNDDLRTLASMCTGFYTLSNIDLSEANVDGNYIEDWIFEGKEKLASIKLPETLEYINYAAFHNCDALTSIDIPASVKRIFGNAFTDCDNLATVTGMEGLSADDHYDSWDVFYGTAITQPVYGGNVFLYMPPSITGEYEMPAGIKMTTAGSMRNSLLTAVTLPASLTDLGDDTFIDCPNMTDIYCYATVPPICHSGVWEFGFDRDACTIHVPASAVEDYKNADEWCDFNRIVGIAIGDLVDVAINVPTAGTLNDEVFDAAVAAANVSDKALVKGLTVTGNINDSDVEYLNTLPNTLYNLATLNMSEATLEGNTITERMFAGTLYKSIHLPETVDSIAVEAFYGSRRLSEIAIPSGVSTIENNSFRGCSALKTVTFAEGSVLRRIETEAFRDLSSLTSIDLPVSLEYIGSYAFAGSGLTSITIPDNVTEMGDRGLQSCGSLTSITLGNGLTYIPTCWAEYCHNLEEVTIGKSVRNISWRVFYGCSIKNVYCYSKTAPSWYDSFYDGINPEAVLHVYENCMSRYQNANGWNGFASIVCDLGTYPTFEIAVNVETPGAFSEALATAMAAKGCEDFFDITVLTVTGDINNADLEYIRDNMGASLDKLDLGAVKVENNEMGDHALSYCGFEEVVLPSTIEHIGGWNALTNCDNLKTLHIPSSVTYIGGDFGRWNRSLETVTGGENMGWLYAGMYFANTPNLKTPVIFNQYFVRLPESTEGAYEVPESVTTIIGGAMYYASKLTSLTLPESVTAIYGYVFGEDVNLRDIYYPAVEVPNTADDAFDDFNASACTLHVYEEMAEVFQAHELWSKFNIVGDLGSIPNSEPIVESDYADLCAIADVLGGDSWSRKWLTNNNVQTASRWRGVTFDEEGYVTDINLEDNNLSGDISALAFNGMTRLKSLNLNSNAITGDLHTLIASLPTDCQLRVIEQDFGYQGEHTLYELCNYGGLPNIAYYNTDSKTFVSTLMGVSGMCRFYHEGSNNDDYWEGYIFSDGYTVNNHKFYWSSPAIIECIYPHRFTFTYNYEMGDANMDDVLNVLDLQRTLNYSNNQGYDLFNFNAANTYNADDEINVQDIVATVNILLSLDDDSESRPANARLQGNAVSAVTGGQQAAEACVSVENGQIVLYTTKPVAALDLRLTGISPEQLCWNTETMGFVTSSTAYRNGTHTIIYSLTPRQMEEGRTVLATFEQQFCPQVASVVLSDANARSIMVGSNAATGISTFTSADGEKSCYSLDGVKQNPAAKLRKGVYVVGGKKTVIK